MQEGHHDSWKHPGKRSSDYSLSPDHNHDHRIYASSESYSGIGPKGYNRDTKIHDEVCELLKANPDVDARGIEVRVRDNCVYLEGSVDSRHAKKVAEEVTEEVFGIADVYNNLEIRPTLDIDPDKIIARGDDGLFSEESIKEY